VRSSRAFSAAADFAHSSARLPSRRRQKEVAYRQRRPVSRGRISRGRLFAPLKGICANAQASATIAFYARRPAFMSPLRPAPQAPLCRVRRATLPRRTPQHRTSHAAQRQAAFSDSAVRAFTSRISQLAYAALRARARFCDAQLDAKIAQPASATFPPSCPRRKISLADLAECSAAGDDASPGAPFYGVHSAFAPEALMPRRVFAHTCAAGACTVHRRFFCAAGKAMPHAGRPRAAA